MASTHSMKFEELTFYTLQNFAISVIPYIYTNALFSIP